ncbi:MAG TPA: hypothetical protein VEN78_19485 [Bradyrhizobium sp.]|nr:hypothetical protein [Bradyrhizobium sp.]
MNPERTRIIKLHKRWADGYTLLWQIFVVLLFGGIYFVLEQFGVAAAERTGVFVLLAVMVLVAAIWQSTGLGIARIHMLLHGIDLERPEGHDSTTGERGKNDVAPPP